MTDSDLPVISHYQSTRVFAWRDGQPVSARQALADICQLARHLPAGRENFNLCDDRYLFTVAFAGAALAGNLTLLPPSRRETVLAPLRETYPNATCVDDACVNEWLNLSTADTAVERVPHIPSDRCVAMVFTSGSTGLPRPHLKHWGDLWTGSHSMHRRFFQQIDKANVVATVPPQHMYGLETSILPALHVGLAADSRCPLLPGDVAGALARVPEPRVLVTTPIHLRACLGAHVSMPRIQRVISASAPLGAELAAAVEAGWHTEVQEIFGSSETGSVASRRTVADDIWHVYSGLHILEDGRPCISGGHLPTPYPLTDALTVIDSQHFRLLGRAHDLLKVAGKRMSLANLNAELVALPGVDDAAVFKPPGETERERPVALVVSARAPREIAAELARRVDPVFVPRPILRVSTLPRNALGKLPQADLAHAWAAARKAAGRGPS